MSRIPPSALIAQAISDFFANGISENSDVKTTLFRLGAQRLIQELLEQEVTDYLGREHYQRRDGNDGNNGYRSGYKERSVNTAEGKIPVYRPQVRDSDTPFVSKLWKFLKGNSDALQYLVMEMYARGLSTRAIEETFTDEEGRCLISKSAVSEATDLLWEEYEAFTKRDLSVFDIAYLFLDAVYEPMRLFKNPKEGVLCAWAILLTGEKVLLHMDLGNKESYHCWQSFLRDMVQRGLPVPLSITSNVAPGLLKALDEISPLEFCVSAAGFTK